MASRLRLISDYKDNDTYRLSFNQLARRVFGIDFERWYQYGFWDDRYICHSLVDGDKVVSNVSVYHMNLVIDLQDTRAIQLGAVMTHPDYRSRGLSRRLMNLVLAEYERSSNLAFLFGHRGVVDYYPRFGFTPLAQAQFESAVDVRPSQSCAARRLNPHCSKDLQLLYRLASSRRPVSHVCGVANAEAILMWYFLNTLSDCFYHLPHLDLVLVCRQQGGVLQLFDVIGEDDADLLHVLPHVIQQPASTVVYGFTPDLMNIAAQATPLEADDYLFARADSFGIGSPFRFPVTAQT